jgi:pantothenate kinase
MAKPKTFEVSKQVKFNEELNDFIEEYRRQQPNIPNYSQAVRDLLEVARKVVKKKKPSK